MGSLNCQQEQVYEQMRQTKEQFGKTDQRQGYHLIISFVEGEVDADTAFEVIGSLQRNTSEKIMRRCMRCMTIQTISTVILSLTASVSVTVKSTAIRKGTGQRRYSPLRTVCVKNTGCPRLKYRRTGQSSPKTTRSGMISGMGNLCGQT